MNDALAPIVLGWSAWMTAMTVQVTLLVAGVALLDRLLAGFGFARTRSGLYLLVGVKLVLPPTLAAWWRTPTEPAGASLGASGPSALEMAFFALWLAGAALAVARGRRADRRFRERLLDRSRPADDGMRAAARRAASSIGLADLPPIRISEADGPLVVGCRRPMIVLPKAAATWRADDLEHALAHELTHLRRRDLWLETAFALLARFYWFHPAVHLVRHRAHVLREMCCDAAVSASFGPAYRHSLIRLAAGSLLDPRPGRPAAAAPFVGRSGQTVARLRALERTPQRRAAEAPLLALGFVLAGCLALPMARPPAAVAGASDPSSSARALAERMAAGRASDPSTTGSMHVRWAVLQLNHQEGLATGQEEEGK